MKLEMRNSDAGEIKGQQERQKDREMQNDRVKRLDAGVDSCDAGDEV